VTVEMGPGSTCRPRPGKKALKPWTERMRPGWHPVGGARKWWRAILRVVRAT